MLAGRPAFIGNTVVAILHATVYEQPPALTGSSAVAAVDRVIRRALAKKPAERPATADAMADELRDVRTGDDDTPTMTHALTRLVVLPFRMLRPDPETDFLAFSLPDAITTSLTGIGSLVVRSSATAARFAGDDARLQGARRRGRRRSRRHAARSCDPATSCARVAQLVEAPGGTVITSHTVQAPLGDLFQLQDDLARRVVEALSLPLGGASDVAGAGCARQSARVRAVSARERAGAHVRRRSSRRATCTSAASRSIRTSRRRGRGSAGAIA